MANLMTGLRIVFSLILLFCPALSPSFFAFYLAAGFTDMMDGFIARRTHTESDFGTKLDTVADFILFAVCFLKLIPLLKLEPWVYGWIALIAFIKAFHLVFGYIRHHQWITVHSFLNRLTGALMFALPFTLRVIDPKLSVICLCAIATIASIQEGKAIRNNR